MVEVQAKTLIELIIEWNNNLYEVRINIEDTVKDLKHVVFTLTNIQSHRQHFPSLTFPVTVEDRNNCKIKQLYLKPRSILKVVDLMPDRRSQGSSRPPAITVIPRRSLLERRQIKSREKHFKALRMPRSGKKLAVLDVDGTIYDCNSPHYMLGVRPHLEEFLISIYEDYDIGIWSATSMQILENKMERLGMNAHSQYKLLFYMDKYSTVMVPYKGCMMQVKPLRLIWARFPQYHMRNTVICDDRKLNFLVNPRNGITVTAYRYKNHHSDKELKYLKNYLKYIAKFTDVTRINHENWKDHFGDNDIDD